MGDRVTVQMPKLPDAMLSTPVMRAQAEPPLAPLAMPKQILTPEPGMLRRAAAAVVARMLPKRAGLRRAD